MADQADYILDLIFGHEGRFSNRPLSVDPGGPTMFGVTARTLGAWRKLGRAATATEVKHLTREEAHEILLSAYLKPIQFAKLPAGVDYTIADCSVNSGPAQAVRIAQQICGASTDGIMGPKTLACIAKMSNEDFINKYAKARLSFMRGLSNWSANKNGWQHRVEQVQARSVAMLVGTKVKVSQNFVSSSVELGADAKAFPDQTTVASTQVGKAGILAASSGAIAGIMEVLMKFVSAADHAGGMAESLAHTLQPLTPFAPWISQACTILSVVGGVWAILHKQGSIAAGEPQEA